MTDHERDPEADGPEGATDPETDADAAGTGADETEITDDTAADGDLPAADEAVDDEELDDEVAAAAGPAGAAAATSRAREDQRRTKGTAPKAVPTPTAADEAVHIQDRVSSWFVIAAVGVFVVIIAWGLLLGRNGLITDALATPKPIATPVETVIPSEAPSVEPSIAPSEAPSVTPVPASPTAS